MNSCLYSLQFNYLHWKLSASRSIFSCYATFDGCCIFNLDSLQTFTGQISSNSSSCGDEIPLSGESRNGLASILTAQCKSCQVTIDFPTSQKSVGQQAIVVGNVIEVQFGAKWQLVVVIVICRRY